MNRWIKIILLFFLFPSYAISGYLEGPFVSNVSPNSVVIWWKSSPPISGKLFLEKDVYKKAHPPFEIHVKGLKPDTIYKYYVVFDNGKRSPKKGFYRFHTGFKGDKPFKFAVIADSRGLIAWMPVRKGILEPIFQDVKRRGVEFVCFLGDMVYGYTDDEEELREELRSWKDIVSDTMHEIPVYTIMGNHEVVIHEEEDRYGKYVLDGVLKNGKIITSEEIFAEEFVNPENSPDPESPDAPPYKETCYSFDFGNSHFVFLNTDYWMAYPKKGFMGHLGKLRLFKKGNPQGRIMDKQIEWLENDLKKARASGIKHIFIFGHEPIFPISNKESIDYSDDATEALKKDIKERRKKIWNMLSRYNVIAAFFGHEHNYSRALIGKTWQIITGGAGAPLHKDIIKDLPWSDKVKIFKARYHYCIVTINKDKVTIDVFALKDDMKGFELIDHADL